MKTTPIDNWLTSFINRLLRTSWFPLGVQVLTLAVFGLLVAGGFTANTTDMRFAKVLRNTNVANLLVWSYWWPMIILSAVFLGRVWCMICPMELVTSLAARVGLKRKPPGWMKSGWGITGFYLLVLFVGIHTLAIHRVPLRMAVYLLVLLLTAVVTGVVFERNTFCAHVCPVGHLLGLYARLAPFGWGVRDKSVCDECKDKSCVSSDLAYKLQARSCGVGIYPGKLHDNAQCLLCGHCLKACERHHRGLPGHPNPGWFRRPWFADILDLKPFTAAQVAFAVVASGFLIYELFTEWSVTEHLLLSVPSAVDQLVGATGPSARQLIKLGTLFVALPGLLWSLPYVLFRLAGGRLRASAYFLRFGIAFIPIMGAAHATKALLKTTSRIPYWSHVMGDPVGVRTAQGLMDGTSHLGALPGWRDPVLTLFALVAVLVGISLSMVATRRLIGALVPDAGWRSLTLYFIPLLYGGGFLALFIAWRVL